MPPKIPECIKIAVTVAVVGTGCWVAGCAKKSGQEAVPETRDTLTTTSDTLSKTRDTLLITHDTLSVISNTLTDTRDGKKYKTVTITDGTGGDSEETRPWGRYSEMNSPAKKRKWLEERFPSVAKDTGYGEQASGKNTESYLDEINCVIDSAIPGFSQWEEFKYRPDSPIMDLLYFTSNPIRPISFRLFKLSGKSSRRACIWVEIWKMRSAADVRKIDSLIYDDYRNWEMYYGSYSPKNFFEFKEYFILVHGCSYMVDTRIFGVNKYIRKRCFDCGTIVGESPGRIGDKYSCYSDKVIFGQNDKDW